ncbi:MAG: Bcr/CflA family efflux MFS transporter [Pedobacter sp.]|nr:MAG: Bcr/CflA family efflux MFS transporter [Pedobacter sp.]
MQRSAERFNRSQLLIVLLLGVLSALGPFSIDMYLPAFPSIAKGLDTTTDAVQLSLAAYFIGISAGQLFYGPITDRFGRKKPLYVGMIIYIIAALGCAVAATIDQLIFFRLLQALGGCAGMVVSRAVVRDLFKPHESAKVFSMLMLVMGVAPIIAPTIGGFVSATWGWRMIFVVLTAISSITFLALARFLPESKTADKSISLNIGSIGKSYYNLLLEPKFIFYAMCGAFASAGMFAYISSSSFIYMELFGYSEKAFGVIFSLNAGGLILCSQLNRIFLKRSTMLTLLRNSCIALMVMGIIILFCAIGNADELLLSILIFVFVSILGFIYPNSTALALAETGNKTGTASALMGALQMFISFLASVAVSMLFNDTILPAAIVMSMSGVMAVFTLLYRNKLPVVR